MNSKLVLWDIDGTLLDDGGVSQEGFSATIKDVLGSEEFVPIEMSGKTDPEIISELLIMNGLSKDAVTSDLIDDALGKYCRHYCAKMKRASGRLYPGIREILEVLDKSKIVFQGLLTGNMQELAILKLSRFSIRHYFKVGGFGNDSFYRQEIAIKAIERASQAFHKDFWTSGIYIVGDTISDIKCGKILGTITVGVATGSTSAIDLQQAGADYVFPDLSNYKYCLQELKLL